MNTKTKVIQKKISVILPVYNGEKFIRDAVNSVLDQTYNNLELIIVNDCSTDNTLNIVRELSSNDERIIIIDNKVNQKLPRSLNIGFAAASGDYYTWTSDDNLYHKDALQEMVKVMECEAKPDLVYADYSIIDSAGNVVGQSKQKAPEEMCFGNVIGACFLYRKELALKSGESDPDFFLAEDYEFFVRCYSSGKLLHLEKCLYDYRTHGESLTETRRDEILVMTLRVIERHFDFLLSLCFDQEKRNRFFRNILDIAWVSLDDEKRNVIRKKLYRRNPAFAWSDRVLRLKNRMRKVIGRRA